MSDWRDARPADFAVIGDPVDHSLSPKMHAAAYRFLGLPFTYSAFRVARGEVAEALVHLGSLGFRGVNVTVPHKREAFEAMREVEPFARRVQAVNTVRPADRAGTNTDGPGFLDTLRDLGMTPGATVLLLGAGGSAVSIAASLSEAGYPIRIYNRTRERAEGLIDVLRIEAEILDTPDPSGCALVVNATSAGLRGTSVPVDWAQAPDDAVAYDLFYGPDSTPFLRNASARGLKTIDGLPLLAAQGARSLEWWLGVEAPRKAMLEVLRW